MKEEYSTLKPAPLISKRSHELAKNKMTDYDVATRLFTEKSKKQKENLLSKTSGKSRKNREEIQNLVDHLFNDAKERKVRQNTVEKKEEVELSSLSTKRILLEKLINDYEDILMNIYCQKNSVLLSFDEFSQIMKTIGLIRLDTTENQQKVENNMLSESWKFLDEQEGKVESNQLLVFLSSVLGLYLGENENLGLTNETKDGKDNKIKEKSIDLFKLLLPGLDLSKYYYNNKIVRQLRKVFKLYHTNRTDYILNKRREKFLNNTTVKSKEIVPYVPPSENLKTSDEIYRRRLMTVIIINSGSRRRL